MELEAKLIKVDGTITDIKPENGTYFQLEELYKLLNISTVQMVPLRAKGKPKLIALCDEEGKMKDGWADKINVNASDVMNEYWGHEHGDYFVGDVIICSLEYFI